MLMANILQELRVRNWSLHDEYHDKLESYQARPNAGNSTNEYLFINLHKLNRSSKYTEFL